MKTPEQQQQQKETLHERFHLDAALLYKDTCPQLSRFLMQRALNAMPEKKSSALQQRTLVCSYCCQWPAPDHPLVRLRPKKRPSARVQSVLRRKARGKRLSLVQRRLLQCFMKSCSVLQEPTRQTKRTNQIGRWTMCFNGSVAAPHSDAAAVFPWGCRLHTMATCHACNKTSRHRGVSRDFIATLTKTHSTPGSAGKPKTPQSSSRSNTTTPKTPGKDKTPAHTPRGTGSSNASGPGSSSSKSSSKPKNWVVQRLSKILMREDNKGSKKGGLKDFLSSL
ncbi:UPF0711 protein C18orf21 homolog isoform X1 [Betta splendens]|uniref:UPF0711 protein C18orf21 homolog isoform X1 n=1 Tax=Betta splendens TaxID=158456 RepID=A0A9W2Y508_BETSP|nr:UPF0711 protein C18orf21 homolog isoform X1 [Betta splendens]